MLISVVRSHSGCDSQSATIVSIMPHPRPRPSGRRPWPAAARSGARWHRHRRWPTSRVTSIAARRPGANAAAAATPPWYASSSRRSSSRTSSELTYSNPASPSRLPSTRRIFHAGRASPGRLRHARDALPAPFDVDPGARGFGEHRARQDHAGVGEDFLARVRRDGDDAVGAAQRGFDGRRRHEVGRFDAAHQHVRLEPRREHLDGVESGRGDRHDRPRRDAAARRPAPRRRHCRPRAGNRAARRLRRRAPPPAHGVPSTQRDAGRARRAGSTRSSPAASVAATASCCGRRRDAFERGRHVRRHGLALRVERRGEHGRQVLRHAEPVAGEVGRDREHARRTHAG